MSDLERVRDYIRDWCDYTSADNKEQMDEVLDIIATHQQEDVALRDALTSANDDYADARATRDRFIARFDLLFQPIGIEDEYAALKGPEPV